MQITAKLLEISATAQVSAAFKKREFVVEYAENPKYPEFLKFELTQEKCELLDKFKVGDTLTVQFNLRGRKWTDPKGEVKYFNSLQAWRLDPASGTATAEDNFTERDFNQTPPPEFDNDDILPF